MSAETSKVEEEVKKAESPDDIQIEVVDDTPPQDRNREPLPQQMVEELDKDDLEEYSEKVRKRLSQMKKVWHDERREKERALREREEAIRFAQTQMEETKRLKQRLGTGEKVFIQEVTRSAALELEAAKSKLKQANETGDPDKVIEAQEALTSAMLKVREAERFKPSLQADEDEVKDAQQARAPQPRASTPDPKAKAWQEKNTWFGTDEEMTALALGLHEKLVRSGVDPRTDEYYEKVNATMRKRFPEYDFGDEKDDTQDEKPERATPSRNTTARPATVVAPATRSTAPRQVRLTPSQIAIAKKLGLSNEQYARELIKLEKGNG